MSTGSPAAAALIAHAAFVVLIAAAWLESGARLAVVFALLWIAGFVGLRYISYGPSLFAPYVAVLDIVLVFAVFKRDVRLR